MSWVDRTWTVRDVMVEDVVTVSLDTPYKRLVELLWLREISGLPVLDENGSLVGIVSESDLILREEHDPRTQPSVVPLRARDLMTEPVVTVSADAPLSDTARLMRERRLKRLPVVDASGRLVGIVSRADLLKVFLRSGDTIEWDVQELVRRYAHSPAAVTVAVREGVVELGGPAESAEEADHLVRAVESLPGVVAVESRLQVRSEEVLPPPTRGEARRGVAQTNSR